MPLWQVVLGSAPLGTQSAVVVQVISGVHVPSTQALPVVQAKPAVDPQPPQLLGSLVVSVHPTHVVSVHPAWAPQSVSEELLHAQMPLWQVVPASVQSLLPVQATPATHELSTQTWPVGHTNSEPHPPQLLESLVVSVHPRQVVSVHPPMGPQSVNEGLLHAQVPLWQVVPASVAVQSASPVQIPLGPGVGVGAAVVGPVALPVSLTI